MENEPEAGPSTVPEVDGAAGGGVEVC